MAKKIYSLEEKTALEREYWQRGICVCGVDEVGRGPLAGPVMAACVGMSREKLIEGVDDSKRVSPRRREMLSEYILENADFIGFGMVEPSEIDATNIRIATRLAMVLAIKQAGATHVLVDAEEGLDIAVHQRAIIGGDGISFVIGAASIVAKVRRDEIMRRYDEMYPGYGFASHKGYGTAEHIKAIKNLGPCEVHRLSFLKNIL